MQKQRTANTHATSESWVAALIDEVRPAFEACGLAIPEKIRGAIAFTSHGKPGRDDGRARPGQWPAECWPAAATDDGFCEIFVRADFVDPLSIARIVCHELIHACLPEAKHGKAFRDAALRLGFEGQMRAALPGPVFSRRLAEIVAALGPLPRGRLNFDRVTLAGLAVADRPRKQTTRMHKAECIAPGCGYTVRVAARWVADCGPPHCPTHGAMRTPPLGEDDADPIEAVREDDPAAKPAAPARGKNAVANAPGHEMRGAS